MSDVHDVMPAAKTILAIDLGEFKSVACVLDVPSGTHRFETIPTNPVSVHDLLAAVAPGRLVIEACSVGGWVHDLVVALSRKILVWCWAMLRDGTEWADPTAAEQPVPTVPAAA